MTGNTPPDTGDIAAAVRDRGMEEIEGAKGRLAEGAERVAAAVERTADDLAGDGDDAISGFGRSVASLMKQLAGGLRERDVEQFAAELAGLARRNPAVFLAGSVAIGFGAARFFRARAPHSVEDQRGRYDAAEELDERGDFDGEEALDLSSNTEQPMMNGGSDS
jgi:hypothetical protein